MPGRSLRFAPSLTSRLEPKFILFGLKEFSRRSRELGSKVVSNREAQDSGRFRFQSAQGAHEVYTMCVRGGPYLTKVISNIASYAHLQKHIKRFSRGLWRGLALKLPLLGSDLPKCLQFTAFIYLVVGGWKNG